MSPVRPVAPAVLLTALALCFASGCGETPGGSPIRESTLRVPQPIEPLTLDPARVQDGPTIEVLMHVFEGLVQWTSDNKLAPALAERWEIDSSGRTYTFHLRRGVKFHNGREVTAEDFVYSIVRSLDAATGSAVAMVYLNDIEGAAAFNEGKASTVTGVSAPDPYTLRLTIDRPKAYFLAKLTYPTAYAVCKEEIEKTGGVVTEASMVGTGPFRVEEVVAGDRTILVANDAYWDGRPTVDRVERILIKDAGARHDKFVAGELDLTDVPMTMVEADRKNPELSPQLRVLERASVYYLALNQQAYPPFRDRRVRRAFGHGVDRREIIQVALAGIPERAEGVVPRGVPGFDPAFRGLPFDPALGRRLLAEAGYAGGKGLPPLTLSFRSDLPDLRNAAAVIQAQLEKNLGVRLELNAEEFNTFLTRRNQGVMPFFYLRWAADYLDPQNFLSTMLHSRAPENTLGYHNPEFDRLCDLADAMTDPQKRFTLYRRAERIVVDDAPWVPLYFQKDVELWSHRVSGIENSLMGRLPPRRVRIDSGP